MKNQENLLKYFEHEGIKINDEAKVQSFIDKVIKQLYDNIVDNIELVKSLNNKKSSKITKKDFEDSLESISSLAILQSHDSQEKEKEIKSRKTQQKGGHVALPLRYFDNEVDNPNYSPMFIGGTIFPDDIARPAFHYQVGGKQSSPDQLKMYIEQCLSKIMKQDKKEIAKNVQKSIITSILTSLVIFMRNFNGKTFTVDKASKLTKKQFPHMHVQL